MNAIVTYKLCEQHDEDLEPYECQPFSPPSREVAALADQLAANKKDWEKVLNWQAVVENDVEDALDEPFEDLEGDRVHEANKPPPVPHEFDYSVENEDEKWERMKAEDHHRRQVEKRESLAEEVRADAGEVEFEVKTGLRVTWLGEQRADPELAPLFKAKQLAEGYRMASDGLLERQIRAKEHKLSLIHI